LSIRCSLFPKTRVQLTVSGVIEERKAGGGRRVQ
jgi:hypothetical protein